MMNKFFFTVCFILFVITVTAQKAKTYSVTSPNGDIEIKINAGSKLTWSVTSQTQNIIAPSAVALHLQNGDVLGDNAQITSAKKKTAIQSYLRCFIRKIPLQIITRS